MQSAERYIAEEQGLFAQIKIGDWVEVESDYSSGICSDGGVGCVLRLHTEPCNIVDAALTTTITAVDVHFLFYNTKERRVLLTRVIVIPMLFKMDKSTLRSRKSASTTHTILIVAPPNKSPLEWLKKVRVGNETTWEKGLASRNTTTP